MLDNTETSTPIASSIKRVPAAELQKYEGILAEDVRTHSGAVLLPAGVNVGLLGKSGDKIVQKIQQEGIEWVLIKSQSDFSPTEVNHLMETIYGEDAPLIDRQKAKKIIDQVDVLFERARDQDFSPELVVPLVNMGEDLAGEILKNPSVVVSLGKVQDYDEYTFTHSFNVAVVCGSLGNRIHPGDRDYLNKIVIGGMMHDLGKAKIPVAILNKPGPLTDDEFKIMKTHPDLGLEMALSSGVTDKDILSCIIGHHEKWGGRGYPNGTKGTDIPEPARICAVADVFDALTAERVYKKGMPSKNAMNIIMRDVVRHFDPAVTRELLVSLGLYPPGSIVELSDGSIALVISSGGLDLIRPVVVLQEDAYGKKFDPPQFLNLKDTKVHITKYITSGEKRTIT